MVNVLTSNPVSSPYALRYASYGINYQRNGSLLLGAPDSHSRMSAGHHHGRALWEVPVKPPLNASSTFQIPWGLPMPEFYKWEVLPMSFGSPCFGSQVESPSEYHLHKAPHTCYLHSILSPTIHVQTLPPKGQDGRAPFV